MAEENHAPARAAEDAANASSDSDADSWHFLSDDSTTVDETHRTLYARRPGPQWKFLTKWIKRLGGRCSISDAERRDSHPVRIGRELDDLWIDVRVENGLTSDATWRGRVTKVDETYRATRLGEVREALLLLAALAQVDYGTWIGALVRKGGFPVPQHLELRHCPEIAREFCFFHNSYLATTYYQWELLRHIMSDEFDVSDEFKHDLAKIQEVAGQEIREFDEIPIKLAIEPEGTDGEQVDHEIAILRGVTHTVRELLAINERNKQAAADRHTRPHFRFECVELNLRSFTIHAEVFDAIRELLETGVRVKTLILPQYASDRQTDQMGLRREWTELVVVALGHRLLASGRPAHVDRLDVSGRCMTVGFMICLCSALRDTRVLRQLSLDFGHLHELGTSVQKRIWTWLDYALFSVTPSNTVDTLELGFLKLRSTRYGELASGHESVDPVGDLWRALMNAKDHDGLLPVHERSSVRVESGAAITTRGIQGRAARLESSAVYSGILIRDQADKPNVDLLVPGFGFCHVSRESITRCESAVVQEPPPQPITTLKIQISHSTRFEGEGDEFKESMRQFTEPLLAFAGPSVTSLGLACDLLDQVDVQMIARLCPRLQNLRLRGLTVASMDVITNLYEDPLNCQISSLDLSHLHVSIEAFENFLDGLNPESRSLPIQQRLERLRVGKGFSGMFRRETREVMLRLLEHNKKLTHFTVFRKESLHRRQNQRGWRAAIDSDSDSDSDNEQENDRNWTLPAHYFNGDLLPEYPFVFERRIAFLSVIRELGIQNRTGGLLGSDLIQLIFSFAADRVWQRVTVERDVDSEMIEFMQREIIPIFERH